MARNTLTDLNNHLFAQLERLSEEGLKPEILKEEIERTKSINGIAKNIIDNAKLSLEGMMFAYKTLPGNEKENLPVQFTLKEKN